MAKLISQTNRPCAKILAHASFWLLCLAGAAATVVLNPVADTTLFESSPDNNLGKSSTIVVGTTAQGQRNRALLKFDLAGALPAGAVVQSASLELVLTSDASNGAGTLTLGLHRMLADWSEGLGNGNQGLPALTGESTWSRRAHPNTAWSVAGAGKGADYASTPSSQTTVGSVGTWSWSAGLAADVQAWANQSASNLGWVLVSGADAATRTARRFASREDAAQSPRLTIQYEVGSNILRLDWPTVEGSQFKLPLHLNANTAYTLLVRETLEAGIWGTAASYAAQPLARDVEFSAPIGSGTRFYRLRIDP